MSKVPKHISEKFVSPLSLSSLLLHPPLYHPLRHLPQHLLLRSLPPLYHRQLVESDEEEEIFFDLEFAVPSSDEKEDKDDGSDTDEDSYNDLAIKRTA